MIASEPFRVAARDGLPLAATVYRPRSTTPVERVVLVCSAMGVRRDYYASFAEHAAERGAAVITFDYRGIGGSRPASLRRSRATLGDWGRLDLPALIDWAAETFPGRRLSAVVHGVGGQILGLAPNAGALGDVLALGAQSGYWGHWRGTERLRVLALWTLWIPVLSRLVGYFPSRRLGLGEDLPAGVAREWAFWGRQPEYLMGCLDPEERARYAAFRGRLRALGALDDFFAPPAAVAAFVRFYPAAAGEHHTLRPAELGLESIGHFGYFRERVGQRLWPRELDWLFGGGAGR